MQINQSNKFVITSLLLELEKYYPNKIPLNTSDVQIEDFRILQGQQDVIQYIRNLVEPEETEDED